MKIKRQTKKQYYNRDKQCIICNKPTNHKYHNRVVDIELLPRILNDILYSTKSYKEIADELGLKQHNVAAIARGELYNELHNYKTPMR